MNVLLTLLGKRDGWSELRAPEPLLLMTRGKALYPRLPSESGLIHSYLQSQKVRHRIRELEANCCFRTSLLHSLTLSLEWNLQILTSWNLMGVTTCSPTWSLSSNQVHRLQAQLGVMTNVPHQSGPRWDSTIIHHYLSSLELQMFLWFFYFYP